MTARKEIWRPGVERRVVVLVVVIVLTGCGALSSGGVDGPVIHQGGSSSGEAALILGMVSLEGDCLYVVDGDVRYPVVWPQGTRWQADPAGVDLGGEVAQLGDFVEGGGGYHQPDRVGAIAGVEAEALAELCVEDPHREVAIFNASSDISVKAAAEDN